MFYQFWAVCVCFFLIGQSEKSHHLLLSLWWIYPRWFNHIRKKWVTDWLIPLTSDTTLSSYQACSKRLAVTLETVVNDSRAALLSGKWSGVSDLHQVTQQAREHARNRICISHLAGPGPCSTPKDKKVAPLIWAKKQIERLTLQAHKCYSEKRKKIPLSCSIKPKPRWGNEEM